MQFAPKVFWVTSPTFTRERGEREQKHGDNGSKKIYNNFIEIESIPFEFQMEKKGKCKLMKGKGTKRRRMEIIPQRPSFHAKLHRTALLD